VPVSDHRNASTQPLVRGHSLAALQARAAQERWQLRRLLMQSPRTLFDVLARVTRLTAALALTLPVLCGALLSWWEVGRLDGLALALNLTASLTLALGIHALSEYRDYRRAIQAQATSENDPLATGYGLMVRGLISGDIALNLGYILLAASALCGLWLPLLAGWPPLFFAGLSVLLLYLYANPPLQYSVHGWGLGEAGILLGFGVLQSLNSYYVQSHSLSWLALLVTVPLGLLCLLLQHNYNLVFERRDWLMRKRTMAVQLGLRRGLDLSALLVVSVHIAIVAIVSLARLPFAALVTLAALPIALGAFGRLDRDRLAVEDLFYVYQSSVTATLWTGLLFALALVSAALW
jgi:1,4-dihydroxy-2-naphthoate polyprenyltransferase